MRINKIAINNFKQYYGLQEIVFAADLYKNVTIINGKNGAGKTNFFTSINWCLYGEEEVQVEDIINKNFIREKSIGDEINARVSIHFNHEGNSYLAVRNQRARKVSELGVELLGGSEFLLFEQRKDGKQQEVPNPLNTLNTILPSNVRTYFLFDGERIDDFAKIEHENEVWNAVRNVLKLEVIERSRDDLQKIFKDYNSELKKFSSGKLNELLQTESNLLEEREEVAKKLEHYNRESRECVKLIEEIERKQAENKETQELANKREKARADRKSRQEQLSHFEKDLKRSVSRSYLVFGLDSMKISEEILGQNNKSNRLSNYSLRGVYQQVIETRECICGRGVLPGSHEHNYIFDKLTDSPENDNSGFFSELYTNIKVNKQERNNIIKSIRDSFSQVIKLKKDIEFLLAQEDEINKQLGDNYKVEENAILEVNRKRYLEKKGELNNEISHLKTQQINIKERLENINGEINKEKSISGSLEKLNKNKNFCQKCINILNDLYENFATEMRVKIEEEASRIFQILIRKKLGFERVLLGSDYKLRLVDRFGAEDARGIISAGERQVLSLAFILGLARVSEEEAPLIMDTPFGRLDSDHRKNIIQNIPSLTSQLALFVTDEELDDDNRFILQDRVGGEYTLTYDDFTGNTIIVKER